MTETAKLKNIYTFQYGKGNNNPDNGGTHPIYGSNGIIGYYDKFNSEDSPVIGHIGANCGSVVFGKGKHFVTYNGIMAKIKSGINPLFGFYTLLNKNLKKITRGSAQPFLSYDMLNDIEIYLPDKKDQDKIVEILSLIDSKIEINKSTNQELENLAKIIYDFWFVQFDFPDENGKPYKHNDGKMEFNKNLNQEIPRGWKVHKVGNILKAELGGTPSTKNESYWQNGTINWLNSSEMREFPVVRAGAKITQEAVDNSATKIMPKGTTAVSITRYIRPTILAIDSCANQSVVGIYENDIFKKSYIYPFLVNKIQKYMVVRTGAMQPHINLDTIKSSFIIEPDQSILQKYYILVEQLYGDLIRKSLEIKELIELKKFLLPLLMNGQVKVK